MLINWNNEISTLQKVQNQKIVELHCKMCTTRNTKKMFLGQKKNHADENLEIQERINNTGKDKLEKI